MGVCLLVPASQYHLSRLPIRGSIGEGILVMEIPLIPFVIRPITEDDLPAILDVYIQCQDFLALGPNPLASLEMVREDILHSQRVSGRYCVVSDPAGKLIGVVDYLPSSFECHLHQAFISLLMISAPYRRRGLGRQVLAQIEAEIRTGRQVNVILTSVQINNPGALNFWQEQGYQIIGGSELQPDSTLTYRLQKNIEE